MRTKQIFPLLAIALLVCLPAFAQDTSQLDSGVVPLFDPPDGAPCLTIDGTLGSGSPSWPSTSGTQTGRLNRNGVASSCAVPKACDIFLFDPGRAYDAYVIPNGTGAVACVDVTLNTITQTACNLQVNAYLDTYDPANICTGYLADPGFSSGTPPNPINFSTNVPAGGDLILVVHTTNPGEIGCQYDLVLDGDCIGAADSDLDLTKSADNDPVPPGGEVTYTLTVTNNGPDDAANTTVVDNLPAEFTWTSDDCGAGPPAGGPPNGTLTWAVGTLANGASASCNVTGTIDGMVGAVVTNDASAFSDSNDPTPAVAAVAVTIQPNVLEIPTLSQIGLVALLLLLAISALLLMRKRAKA